MEVKWYMIAVSVMMVASFGALAYSSHEKSQCRIAYAKSNRSVEDIAKICDKD